MADNEQAKSSANLGELFVEFGSKGMGGLIKGLNSVSASFLLTKNAGQQMLQPLANMSKQAGQGVIALDKLNSVTGISVKQLYRLRQWTKLNNIDFSDYVGQVHSLQNAIGRMYLGDDSAIQGFSMLGLNPADFNPAKPLENMNKIKKAMLDMYRRGGEGAKFQISLALQMLGLSEDLAYAFMNANKQLDERILLNDKELQQIRDLTTETNNLSLTWGNFIDKTVAKLSTHLIPMIKEATSLMSKIYSDNDKEKKEARSKVIKGGLLAGYSTVLGAAAGGALTGTVLGAPGIGTAIGGIVGLGAGLWGLNESSKSKSDLDKQIRDNQNIHANRKIRKDAFNAIEHDSDGFNSLTQPTAQGINALNKRNTGIPFNAVKNDNRRAQININVEQNITGDNAQDSADQVTNIMRENLITLLGYDWIINQYGGFNK